MIFKQNIEDVMEMGSFESTQMSVDLSDPQKIIYMLSQGLYKLPMHSALREGVSNSIDAIVESGKNPLDYPVVVGLDHKKLWIKDQGYGISLDRMQNVISKFGASTKTNSANLIGFFGLGLKSPWAYTNNFTIESCFDGVKRQWLFSKDGSENSISLLSENECTEDNYTTVIIPINNDYYEWRGVITETLLYFKGVVIDNEQLQGFNISTLYDGKTFLHKKDYTSKEFHVVLDQVVYELSPTDFDLPNIDFPFAIKFTLMDGLTPTPSRESLLITSATKKIVRERVKECVEEIKEKISKSHENLYTFLSGHNKSYTVNLDENYSIQLNKTAFHKYCNALKCEYPSSQYVSVKPEFNDIPSIKSENYRYLLGLLVKSFVYVGNTSMNRYTTKQYVTFDNNHKTCIIIDTPLNKSKIEFFKSKLSYTAFFKFERKLRLFKGNPSYYSSVGLNLRGVPKKDWRGLIQAWQTEEDRFVQSLPKVSDYLTEYEEWLKNRPKKVKEKLGEKEEGDITIRFAAELEKDGSDYLCKFVPDIVKISRLHHNKDLGSKIYVYSDERETIHKLWPMSRNVLSIKPVLITKTEIKKIEHLDNFIKYEDFTKGKSRLSHRYITALIILEDIAKEKYLQTIFNKKESYYSGLTHVPIDLNSINKTLVKQKIQNITNYLNKWKKHPKPDDLFKSLIETYIKLGLVDKPVLREWESLKEDLKPLFFVHALDDKHLINRLYIMQRQNKFLKNKISKINKIQKSTNKSIITNPNHK